MPRQPLFAGLIIDEFEQPVGIAYVGEEPCYIVDDQGFKRHIPSEHVDRQVLDSMYEMIEGHEDLISEQAAKMMGQDDIFSVAMLASQLKQFESQFNNILDTGIPEEGRAYLGMMGFKIRINLHGDVLEIEQPGMIDPDNE